MRHFTSVASRLGGALAVSASAICTGAHAGELYVPMGLPGTGIGWAQPMGPQLGLRADIMGLGSRTAQRTEDGIRYDATLKLTRLALLADWFPLADGFRLTGGLTRNDAKLDMVASGAGGSLSIGSTTYTTTAADRFAVQVVMPKTTPYLGLGWGHHAGKGWRFSFDVGASVGRATLSYALSGPLAGQVSQADIDAELTELRDGVGKVRALPQLNLGLGYSF
jgi:hypothetical protein